MSDLFGSMHDADERVYRIKIFLCVLLRDFEFSLDEGVVIEKRVTYGLRKR